MFLNLYSIAPQALGAAMQVDCAGDLSINWTIGEPAPDGTPSIATYIVTEDLHDAGPANHVIKSHLITHLYPNPINDRLHVNIQQATAQQLQVHIADSHGRIVRSMNHLPQSIHITTAVDFSSLATGNYVVMIDAGAETIYTAEVIKQ